MIKIFDNQNQNYPIVFIPEKILEFIHSEIDETTVSDELNIFKPQKSIIKKPEKPSKYIYKKKEKLVTRPTRNTGCIPIVFLISIVLSFSYSKSFNDGLQFVFIGQMGFWIFFSLMAFLSGGEPLIKFKTESYTFEVEISKEELNKLELDYKENIKKFALNEEKSNRQFKKDLDEYLAKIELNKNKIKNKIYRKVIKPHIISSRGSISPIRGAAELKFLGSLDEELKGLISVDMVPRFHWNNNRLTYNPDFTLICKRTNLHIDIEIDEPYSRNEKKPIHYIGCSDDKRNNFFLENNWCIIRFSENQIIQNTFECINTIKSIYKSIIIMRTYYSTNLKEVPRWTYEESLIMQQNRFRESYL